MEGPEGRVTPLQFHALHLLLANMKIESIVIPAARPPYQFISFTLYR